MKLVNLLMIHQNIKKQLRWFIYIIGSFFIIATILLFYESSQEVSDLSLIGKGKNVIVQVHDPG